MSSVDTALVSLPLFAMIPIDCKITNFLTRRAPTAGCGHVPGFLKLLYEKCVCMRMYVCRYVYLFVFPHPREQTFYMKLESSLYTNNKG